MLSRRNVLATAGAGAMSAATARAADFGNPDQPPEGAVNVTNPKALTDPGPQDRGLAGNEAALQNPPATDVTGMSQFCTSFNLSPKRIQNGGWARQITSDDFKISSTIAGVNMRLGPNGVRELHWHQQAEWAVVTAGTCRITILDQLGRPQVADVAEGAEYRSGPHRADSKQQPSHRPGLRVLAGRGQGESRVPRPP
jgi:oxalate decarboxylase